ncbi:hypothetical protein [Facklamia sp. P12937]|uniref:hypothetical protein n=1 Tax=unclassified Facklamia TaxID=2622293 RepID=UPI003D162831
MIIKDVTPEKTINKKANKRSFNPNYLYVLLALAIFVYYYLTLPPIHYASYQSWFFLLLIVAGVFAIELIKDSNQWFKQIKNNPNQVTEIKFGKLPKKYRLFYWPVVIVLLVGLIGKFVFSPFFMAKDYGQMISPVNKDFETTFPEVNIDNVPLVDRDTAVRLGDRYLGALTELVSQFEVSDEYTQINIEAEPYRVTPLKYAGLFKWLNNFSEGIPHYLQVDNVTGKVEVKTPEKPIRYSYSDHFGRNISRHLRFNYPFSIFESPDFEIDDEGNPYYIATSYGRNFFLNEPEPNGLIIVNAMTGEHQKYSMDEIPSWVDRVYSADLIMHQLDQNGKYKNGFWNSVFAKEGVTETSKGYNYLPMNDDIYLYTGITSVVSDESNIGFVLVNLRTKEATMYNLSAAEEFSAMASAEGSVQEKGYIATFPLLINLQGNPMYILTLKDSSGLIKNYSLVDVQDYQKVYIASNMTQLIQKYGEDNPVVLEAINEDTLEKVTGKVEKIQAVIKEGETFYYFMLDGNVYQVPAKLNDYLPFVEEGQTITLKLDDRSNIHLVDLTEIFGDKAAQEEVIPTSEDTDPLLDNVE